MKKAAHAIAACVRDSKHQSNYRHPKPEASSQILMRRYKWIINWYVGAWIYIKMYGIKARMYLACVLNGILQFRDRCMDAWTFALTVDDYVSIHQFPSLCSAIQSTGPGFLAIILSQILVVLQGLVHILS